VRRGLGRGRALIAIGSILAILGMPLPWLTVGGVVLSEQSANGFEGAGVLTFLASVAMLALIVAPYTTRSRRFALDRAAVYAVLVGIGSLGVLVEIVELLSDLDSYGALPTEAPGLWLAIAGMAVATWGVLELIAERPAAP
jgi:hypothetical protein